jgi:hypothetical protein
VGASSSTVLPATACAVGEPLKCRPQGNPRARTRSSAVCYDHKRCRSPGESVFSSTTCHEGPCLAMVLDADTFSMEVDLHTSPPSMVRLGYNRLPASTGASSTASRVVSAFPLAPQALWLRALPNRGCSERRVKAALRPLELQRAAPLQTRSPSNGRRPTRRTLARRCHVHHRDRAGSNAEADDEV